MRVRNRTGVQQKLQGGSITLPPMEWVDNVPAQLAAELARNVQADIESSSGGPFLEGDGVHLLWHSPFSLGDGYATASMSTIEALLGSGQFHIQVKPCWFEVRKGLSRVILGLLDEGLHEPFPRVGLCMATPGEFQKMLTEYRIGLTMYEASKPLEIHPEWRQNCTYVDELFVPSVYCRQVFSEFVDRPIKVVPLATNPIYCEGVKVRAARLKAGLPFTFFTHGTLTDRKSPIELLGVFKKVFPKLQFPDVRMVFKTRAGVFGFDVGQPITPKEIDDPRVIVYDEDWLPERMLQQFNESDCYVFPSKGEGFGMTPREAMSAGLPTVFSDNTGLSEIANRRYNWPIRSASMQKCPLGGDWDVPDWKQLGEVMQWHYYHREEAQVRALEGAQWLQGMGGPEAIAKEWQAALGKVDVTVRRVQDSRLRWSAPTGQGREPFVDYIRQRYVTREGTLYDLGGRMVHLLPRGRVVSLIDTDDHREALASSAAGGYSYPTRACRLPGLGPLFRVTPQPFTCVSMDTLHRYYDAEIKVLIRSIIGAGGSLIFTVPSIHFDPNKVQFGERLMGLDNWLNLLMDYEMAVASYYGVHREYLMFAVVGMGRAGVAKKNYGRIAEGIWRPTTERKI